ncbi:MAG: glycosyltransferase [Oscillospiraceae bacterium]|nr:glycosyltransferase [Oscillospiraceae bacterium]
MKLSVIVPAYNAEKTIRECVDSILSQTVSDLELIVVNDGSTDATEEILQCYVNSDPDRFQVVTVENGGQGRARNIGLERAKGEFVGFIDSDDWIDPEMYARMIQKAEEEHCDLVICDAQAHFPDGKTEKERLYREDRLMAAVGSSSNKLFCHSLIEEIRFPEGIWYEDAEFSARALIRAEHCGYIPETFYHYRRGYPSTMNNSNARKNLDILTVLEHLEEDFLPNARDDYEFLVINHVLLDAMNRVQAMDSPEKKDVLWLMRAWVHEKIPHLRQCGSFQQESRNRRIIMMLHYLGLSPVAETILNRNRRR